MSNPVCSATTLVTNASEYNQQFIDPKTARCLAIYAKVLELSAIGGTNYNSSALLVSDLAQDASSLFAFFTPDAIKAANIAINFQNATAAGATVPATLALKMEVINKLIQEPDSMLTWMDTLLNCKLGVHKAYPQ